MADRMDETLDRVDRGEIAQSTLRDARKVIDSDPVARPDVGGALSGLAARVGRMFGRGSQRDTRDTSRSTRR